MTLPLGKNLSVHLTLVAIEPFDRQDHGVSDLKVAVLILISIGAHADSAIRQDILIHNEDELIHAMNHFELRGGGGTDFRPAFDYVNQLCAEKKFSNLRGLLYFTDGMGTYPARRPAYDTAFLFLGEKFDDANVPPWAMKVVLDEEEFTGAAARPQSTLADALAEEDDLYRDLNNS